MPHASRHSGSGESRRIEVLLTLPVGWASLSSMGGISHLETQLPECAGRTVHPIVVKTIHPNLFPLSVGDQPSARNRPRVSDRQVRADGQEPTPRDRLPQGRDGFDAWRRRGPSQSIATSLQSYEGLGGNRRKLVGSRGSRFWCGHPRVTRASRNNRDSWVPTGHLNSPDKSSPQPEHRLGRPLNSAHGCVGFSTSSSVLGHVGSDFQGQWLPAFG